MGRRACSFVTDMQHEAMQRDHTSCPKLMICPCGVLCDTILRQCHNQRAAGLSVLVLVM